MEQNETWRLSHENKVSKEAAAARSALAFAEDALFRTPEKQLKLGPSNIRMSKTPKIQTSQNRPLWKYTNHGSKANPEYVTPRSTKIYRKPPVPTTNSKSRYSTTGGPSMHPNSTVKSNNLIITSSQRKALTSKTFEDLSSCNFSDKLSSNELSIRKKNASHQLKSSNLSSVKSFSQAHNELLNKLAQETTALMADVTDHTTRTTALTVANAILDDTSEVDRAPHILFEDCKDETQINGDNSYISNNECDTQEVLSCEVLEDVNQATAQFEDTFAITNDGHMEASALALVKAREVLTRSVSLSPEPEWYKNFKCFKAVSLKSPSPASISSTPPPPPSLSPSPHPPPELLTSSTSISMGSVLPVSTRIACTSAPPFSRYTNVGQPSEHEKYQPPSQQQSHQLQSSPFDQDHYQHPPPASPPPQSILHPQQLQGQASSQQHQLPLQQSQPTPSPSPTPAPLSTQHQNIPPPQQLQSRSSHPSQLPHQQLGQSISRPIHQPGPSAPLENWAHNSAQSLEARPPSPLLASPPRSAFTPIGVRKAGSPSVPQEWAAATTLPPPPLPTSQLSASIPQNHHISSEVNLKAKRNETLMNHQVNKSHVNYNSNEDEVNIGDTLMRFGEMANSLRCSLKQRLGRNLSQEESDALLTTAQLLSCSLDHDVDNLMFVRKSNGDEGRKMDVDHTRDSNHLIEGIQIRDEKASFEFVHSKLGELEATMNEMKKGQTTSSLASDANIYDSKYGSHSRRSEDDHVIIGETFLSSSSSVVVAPSFASSTHSLEEMDEVDGAVEAVVRAAQKVSLLEASFGGRREVETEERLCMDASPSGQESKNSLLIRQQAEIIHAEDDGQHSGNDEANDDDTVVEEEDDEVDGDGEDALYRAARYEKLSSMGRAVKQWRSWLISRQFQSSAVLQCRGRLLKRRQKKAIKQWSLFTRSRFISKQKFKVAEKLYVLNKLRGSVDHRSISSNMDRFSLRKRIGNIGSFSSGFVFWYIWSQQKKAQRLKLETYLKLKHLRKWNKRVNLQAAAKLVEWRGVVRFEQRSLSRCLGKWRRHLFETRTNRLNLLFFNARHPKPKAGLGAKCLRLWREFVVISRLEKSEFALQLAEQCLRLKKVCFNALIYFVEVCTSARALLRYRWNKRTKQQLHDKDEKKKRKEMELIRCRPLIQFRQFKSLEKWKTFIILLRSKRIFSKSMNRARTFYRQKLLRLVIVSWTTWPALAERRACKFWVCKYVRPLLWRWFDFTFQTCIREARLIRLLRMRKSSSSFFFSFTNNSTLSKWKQNHMNIQISSNDHSFEKKIMKKDVQDNVMKLLSYPKSQSFEKSIISSSFTQRQSHPHGKFKKKRTQTENMLRIEDEEIEGGKTLNQNSYASLHSVKTKIQTMDKQRKKLK